MPSTKTIRLNSPPQGFQYKKNVVTEDEEAELIRRIEPLSFKEYEFHGYLAKRRTISFGWHYSFGKEALLKTQPIPEFLKTLRERAAKFADLTPDDLPHILVTEYGAGTPIGWHRDRPVFEDVIGVSLRSRSLFRLRRRTAHGWERYTQILDPRSIYLLRGQVRTEYEHSIPEVEDLRYSITFRSLRM